MLSKFFFTATLSLVSITLLSAQAPIEGLRYAGLEESDISSLVTSLEHSALQYLLGIVILLSMIWIGCIVLECKKVNNKVKSSRQVSCLLLLVMATSMNFLGTSCSVNKMMIAAETQKGKAVEGGVCTCHTQFNNYPSYNGIGQPKNLYPYFTYDQMPESTCCSKCKLRRYGR